jgi:O-antigen ligase
LRRADVLLYLLAGVVALLPFGVVPLRLGVAPTLLDLATAGVFIVWLALAAGRRAAVLPTLAGAALLALTATWTAAYVLAGEALSPNDTARTFAKVAGAHLLFIPALGLVSRDGGHTARRLAAWIVALAAVEALLGIALYVMPRDLAYRALVSLGPLGYPTDASVLRYRPDTDVLRATATSIDPNMLGALLMVAAAVAAPQLLARHPQAPRPLVAAALAAILICLLLTESRGSWLGLAGGLVVVAIRHRRLWALFALAGVVALSLPQAQRFTGHLGSGLRAEDRAAAMRLGEIENALTIIHRYPWFGAGWSAAGKSIELTHTLGVSNVILTVAERSGLAGAAAYVAALLALIRTLWPAARSVLSGARDDPVLLGLLSALAATQIAAMLDHHFVRFPHLIALLWLVAALAVCLARAVAAPKSGRVALATHR